MESLALIVTIILSLLMVSGPITILLTSPRLQLATRDRVLLKRFRRSFLVLFVLLGSGLGVQFLITEIGLPIKLFALITIAGNVYAVGREIKYTRSH